MDKRELKTGNYVRQEMELSGERVLRTYGIDMDVYSYESACPIGLTREWVQLLGFYDGPSNLACTYPPLVIIETEHGWKAYWRGETLGVFLSYVHELQNLYFGLTGQDLKIQTPKNK